MTALLGFVLACAGLAALASLVIGPLSLLAWSAAAPHLAGVRPARRADAAFIAGVVPASGVLVVIAGTALPSLLTVAGLAADHCDDHGHHVHVCALHAAHIPSALAWVGAAALAAFLVHAGSLAFEAFRNGRRLGALERMGRVSARAGFPVHGVPGSPRLCLAVGVLRRRVVYSVSLADHLAPDELDAALTHETAHLARFDTLALAVLQGAGLLLPPLVGRRLRVAFRDAAEEACDAAAAERHQTVVVAQALVSAARLQLAAPAGLALAGDALAGRVTALLGGVPPRAGRAQVLPLVAALGIASVSLVGAFHVHIHHAVETLLSLLH